MCSLSPIFDTHVHFRIFETFPSLLLGHCVSCNTRSNQFPSLFSTISLFTISSYKKILSHNWTIWYNFREYLVSLVDINFSKYFNERPLNVSIITIQFFERGCLELRLRIIPSQRVRLLQLERKNYDINFSDISTCQFFESNPPANHLLWLIWKRK